MKYTIFVLSPEKFIERRNHISRLFDKASIKFEFLSIDDEAVLTPDSIKEIHDKKRTLDSFGRDLTRGELASTLNHLLAYRKFLDSNNEVVVILEDDANFNVNNFRLIIDLLIKMVNNKKPQVYLLTPTTSYLNHNAKQINKDFKIVNVVAAWGAGYIINRAAATKILDVNARSWIICDDWVKYKKYANINLMAVVPPIIQPDRRFESNLLADHEDASKQKAFKQRSLKYILSRNKDKIAADLKKYLWLIPFRGYIRNNSEEKIS